MVHFTVNKALLKNNYWGIYAKVGVAGLFNEHEKNDSNYFPTIGGCIWFSPTKSKTTIEFDALKFFYNVKREAYFYEKGVI